MFLGLSGRRQIVAAVRKELIDLPPPLITSMNSLKISIFIATTTKITMSLLGVGEMVSTGALGWTYFTFFRNINGPYV